MSPAEKSVRPEQNRDLRCQSGPSASVEETLQRNVVLTNNDCRFLISTLTISLHQQPSLAGRWGSRPRYVLVHNFLRKRCNGLKKWNWLIQWTIWDLRHLFVVFQCRSSVEETIPRIMGQTNNDCRFRIFTLTSSLHQRLACWKIRFKTEVCTCSQFPTEAMQWIKEVELVDSVDDLKSSRSIRGTHGLDFEVLDARTASALNKIIHNSQFKRRISLEDQEARKRTISFAADRLPTWSTITSGSLGAMILSKTTPICVLIFGNLIRSGTEFCPWRKSRMMTSWKDCTNQEHESLISSRPHWNCMTWRLIRRS